MSQKRCFNFSEDFITCDNCHLNYKAYDGEPGFCQEFSLTIDPEATQENNKRGLDCPYWLPKQLVRDKVSPDAPPHERWYEKDSIA